MFEIVEGPEKGHVSSKLSGDAYVEEFSVVDSWEAFTLEPLFSVKLSTAEEMLQVRLLEDRLWEALYMEES